MTDVDRTNMIAGIAGIVPLAVASIIGVVAAIKRRKEVVAGAPLYPGRWAAIAWFYWAGEFFGEVSLFNGVTGREWALMIVASVLFIPLGIISLDRYGRQAWFAANPDGIWNGLASKDIDRRRWLWSSNTK